MHIIKAEQQEVPTFPIALIVSRFNEEYTDLLYEGALKRLKELDFPEHQITVLFVPGAVEIPLAAQRLARLGKFEAIIAFGVVIRGETSHYDVVCEQASQGCQQVSLKHDLPVIFGVLTTNTAQQAQARLGGDHGHKGIESVNAAVEMVTVLRSLD